jgi:hypothetical protein
MNTIINFIHDELFKKLSQINKEALSMPQLLHQHCKLDQEEARYIVKILQQ